MQTVLLRFYIYLKCVYSQHAHKVLSAMLSAMHSHKKRPSFYLPPCFLIPPATTAVSIWLIYNCILIVELYIDFLCYFCVFLAAETQVPSVYGTAGASID